MLKNIDFTWWTLKFRRFGLKASKLILSGSFTLVLFEEASRLRWLEKRLN